MDCKKGIRAFWRLERVERNGETRTAESQAAFMGSKSAGRVSFETQKVSMRCSTRLLATAPGNRDL